MKKKILCFMLICAIVLSSSMEAAATKTQIQQQINEAEGELEEAQERIDELSRQQELISQQIDEANADLVDLLVQIRTAEQSIAATEDSIQETQIKIDEKTVELEQAEADRQEQYEKMKARIRYIYENGGSVVWLDIIMGATSFESLLNRTEYAQVLYDYDRKLQDEYVEAVQQVADLKAQLEEEMAVLEEEKAFLEVQKSALLLQQNELETSLAQLESASEDYETKLSKASAQAEAISSLIAEQESEMRRIEEAERRAREEEERRQQAAQNQNNNNNSNQSNNNSSGGGSSTVPTFTGTATGAEIVDYANQFVGNPYVWGGNSLTDGIDCSHFVYQVLKNCGVYSGGYVTSAGWRTKGEAVASLDEAQAGDILCYSGHVAIYDGNGGIVEAMGSRWGITNYRSATYKPILAIRRFVD